jgi:very-short-patch-repair endonuclease
VGGFRESKSVLRYRPHLKDTAREIRKNMTDSERVLWSRLRGKQLLGVQFYRQKPIVLGAGLYNCTVVDHPQKTA